MSLKMYPIPLRHLTEWINSEFRNRQTIFGIPAGNFSRTPGRYNFKIGNQTCARPLGPAAGPHTQMTQNIIAAYLTGARFFELKTVQIMDNLEIAKPCISAEREGYNTEWSTELSVPQALDEYLKAWLLIPYIRKMLYPQLSPENDGVIFNMSVGYDLAGIKSAKIDRFIESLKSAETASQFNEYQAHLSDLKNGGCSLAVSPNVCNSITLSTMHGCPPAEIEAIASYLLREKHLHTYVKLNPTLLGYDFVRKVLDQNGFGHIQLKPASFEHDLQFEQAQPMLTHLRTLAKKLNLTFGVKLSNTLPVVNNQGQLPGTEMYMSGQALYPLTINLAFRLAQSFDGKLPISYSGGADALNIGEIIATGIAPITVTTALLKPGGYLRLKQLAEEIDQPTEVPANDKIDIDRLGQLAEQTLQTTGKRIPLENKPIPKAERPLPLFDCFIAPCQECCPIHQDVASYLRQIRDGHYDAALASILIQNPLPNITGHICDHQCMTACTRNYYDDSLAIREMKKVAANSAHIQSDFKIPKNCSDKKIAILGAGPAGLATAFFLAKAGLIVTVFDKNPQAGGTVRFIIPGFRLPLTAIERDVQLITSLGVEFVFNQKSDLTIEDLRRTGFTYIVLAIGTGDSPALNINSDNPNILEAVEFLKKFNAKAELNLGRAVAVVGGGNSAMDAARAARRVPGVEEVFILYRRTISQMPADREELENAITDGVEFRELINPVAFTADGILKCQRMKLGEPDSSGRPRPVPVDEFEELHIDTLITAIGERVDRNYLEKIGLSPDKSGKLKFDPTSNETEIPDVFIGGDAARGPATVVEAIADGRKIASAILAREHINYVAESITPGASTATIEDIYDKKGRISPAEDSPTTTSQIQAEADRCLECDQLCTRCVDVCPNRANIAVRIEDDKFGNAYQIVHLDVLCNECGNCATFCLYENGQPYHEKFTLFADEPTFRASRNSGFVRSGETYCVRINHEIWEFNPAETVDNPAISADKLPVIHLIQTLIKDYKYLFI